MYNVEKNLKSWDKTDALSDQYQHLLINYIHKLWFVGRLHIEYAKNILNFPY